MKNQPIRVKELQGVYTAIITPMYEDGDIDYKKLDQLIDNQIVAGVQGILACGTTGQSATLSHKEHVDLVEYIFDYIDGRTRFIAGAGSNCTRESIELTNEIEKRIGPTTLLHVTGYYNNPPQEGLIAHYSTIADSLSLDSNIILYNVPGRTNSNIESNTAITLSQNSRIIGVKEASGNIEQVERIIQNTDSDNFRVVSGEDDQVAPIIEMGGYGVISASANVAPSYFVKMTKTALEGNNEYAQEMQEHINPLVKTVFCAKNPIPLTHMFNTHLRLPLVRLPRIESQIQKSLTEYSVSELGIDLANYK